MARELVSIIAPVYNEAGVIAEFVQRTVAAIRPLETRYDFELILVNDGSRDGSLAVLKGLVETEPRLRVIDLRRNYGQTPALQAGLDAADGQIFLTLDADLQHFPEEIPTFLETLDQGHDMVCGWRHERPEGIIRRWPSRAANRFIRAITGLKIHDFGTTFRAYRAEVARDLRLYGEFHRYIPALGHMLGSKITEIPIRNIERPEGKSNYGLGRTFGVALDLLLLHFLVHYLDRPLRVFGKLAVGLFVAAGIIVSVLLGLAFYYHYPTFREHAGWFQLAVVLCLTGTQLLMTGILAEILVRIHFGQDDRRVYQVRAEWSGALAGERAGGGRRTLSPSRFWNRQTL